MSDKKLSRGAQVIQVWLTSRGYQMEVGELPDSTRTAADAAQAIGCKIGQIVKSLVFRGETSNKPILILASGPNRVNEAKIAELIGESIIKADPEFVRTNTGFSIGGVPPIGHKIALTPIIDADLLAFAEIWAAAGSPFAVFRTTPDQLIEMSQGSVGNIS